MKINTIQHFTDLNAWQKNHEFVKLVYKVTQNFPTGEQFGLTNQLRRSASSITANIAEGYGRYHLKDKIKFYYQARGSNTESQNHIILAFELNYLSEEDYNKLKIVVFEGYKLICGLIRSTSNQI
ncbi:MAG: hypothetical protein A2469_02350 [Candidatus Magasanikbacteria bacterium RIFOXYC2_FULL_40_16]|uniref:Four helix bundle protein n=2 Tax=Candidatus Magasanikiibacteriota TaxID=1752731 RepID=A0A1F6NEP5_9BACT|nr:MAG: hypothetical protein A2224_01790 [Candidatus Magasanikbacteria bacterium RIFOXYA2_FULL_40_20]OGH82355.1 MAG: hypothetical protein A2373_04030 [Candidatus Magasanikbacteria bacterium RIFOXYB1_FULL_40_15]OGH89245.1 MAG: hypothetical protein A2469_02350 [Candidatus Magasanikbacteria bacterium RIFOXYC2_FULL_40_16]